MEQMANLQALDDQDPGDVRTAWRSVGGIAANLLARVEAQRASNEDENRYAALAWAAE